VSALTGAGLQPLVAHIQSRAGAVEDRVGSFSARRRHLAALARAAAAVRRARAELAGAPEVAAEELREAQQALSELTGEVTSDDLLGEIFSTFCIGK
jgi:tRNA modification GTPase